MEVKKILIVGGGTAGIMTAALLSKVFKDKLDITLIHSNKIGTIGVGESSTASLHSFMKFIGLEEKEIDEDDTLNVVNDPDATEDGMGIFEEDKNIAKASSICHSQVGPKKSRKWERCVKEVKKQLKEGKNPVSLFLESQIQKIVEKHMPPKITKGDLVKYISEQGTAPAPTTKPSPTTKPGTKPGKRPNPFKNPNPGENPAPKAKRVSPEDAKEKVIDVIMQLLEK